MRYVLLPLMAFLLLLAQQQPVQAEFIPWKYNWSRSPSRIMADAPGTGFIELTDERLQNAAGDSDIVATNLKVFSDAPPNRPDVFTEKPYTLTLFLLDLDSGESGTLSFTGQINGTVSSLNTNLRNRFTGDPTQSLLLGESLYTVTIGPYSPPGPPGSTNSGAVSAYAQVTVVAIHKTPEPSTLVLAGLSIPFAYGIWRKRRSRAESAS